MKLVTLNIWGGIVYEPLSALIQKLSSEVDVFCFQEVVFGSEPSFTAVYKARVNIFEELQAHLSDFVGYDFPAPPGNSHFQDESIEGFPAGQAIFVRNGLKVLGSGGFRTYHALPSDTTHGGKLTGSCQWIEIEKESEKVTIASLHGLWQKGTSKVDTPERLLQSQIIQDFFKERTGKKILCGDFNLIPDGESMAILERNMRNLIKEYNITSTRSSFYKKENKFADYILVSPDVKVEDFKVLPDEVSDHMPLLLSFE